MCCILKRPDLHICAAEQREKCVSDDSSQRILKLQSQRHSLSLALSLCPTPGNPSPESQRSQGAPVCSALSRQRLLNDQLLSRGKSGSSSPAGRANGDICERVRV